MTIHDTSAPAALPSRTPRWAGGLLTVCAIAAMLATMLLTPAAGAETPEQRCQRETTAYNNAWAQSWAASNPGKSPTDAPPPPVPYICRDPLATPETTPETPTAVVPTLPGTTTPTTPGDGPTMTAHAPTDIPSPGRTPIVPVPTTDTPPAGPVPFVDSLRRNADNEYDTNEVVGEWEDTCGNRVPLRRGYFDGKKGRGWDKIYHYHNMTNKDVIQRTIENNCGELDTNDTRGRTLIYREEFYRQECSWLTPQKLICEKKPPPVTFRLVVQMSDTLPNGDPLPDGKASGVVSGYCVDYTPKCPGWMSSPEQIDTVGGLPLNSDPGSGPTA